MHVNNWDILESAKFSSPTLWSHFAGVKMDRKPLTYENQFFSTMQHNHMLEESPVFYLPTKELEVKTPPSSVKPASSKSVKSRTNSTKAAIVKETPPSSPLVKIETKLTKAAPAKRQRRRSTLKEKEEKRTTANITATNAISKGTTGTADSIHDRQFLTTTSSATSRNNASLANDNYQSMISNQVKVAQPVPSYTISDRSQSDNRSVRKNSNSTCLRDLLDHQTAMQFSDNANTGRSQMQSTIVTSASDYSTFQSMNNSVANMNQVMDNNFNDSLSLGTHSDNLSQQSLQGIPSSLMDSNSMLDSHISGTNFMNMPVGRSTNRMPQNLINSTGQQPQSNDVLHRINKFNSHSYH